MKSSEVCNISEKFYKIAVFKFGERHKSFITTRILLSQQGLHFSSYELQQLGCNYL